MALPFSEGRFDAAIMALVIFFVPDPGKGVAEMARVVRPGGTVATYAWDVLEGGSPAAPIQAELLAMGLTTLLPPSAGASRMEALRNLWSAAGPDAVETREIVVQRTFADFEDFWTTNLIGASVRPTIAAMSSGDVELLKTRVRARLPPDAVGCIGLPGTKMEGTTCGTIRLQLLKIGALVTVSVRRVKVAFASACPSRDTFGWHSDDYAPDARPPRLNPGINH